MAKSGNFRKHHQDLKQFAGQISQLLNPTQLRADGTTLRQLSGLLAELTRRLNIHLSIEDMVLYPRLLRDSDGPDKALAQKYHNDVGGLAKLYEQYCQKWSTPEAIQADPEQFSSESRYIFEILARRIEKEENELYPLYDKLPAGAGRGLAAGQAAA